MHDDDDDDDTNNSMQKQKQKKKKPELKRTHAARGELHAEMACNRKSARNNLFWLPAMDYFQSGWLTLPGRVRFSFQFQCQRRQSSAAAGQRSPQEQQQQHKLEHKQEQEQERQRATIRCKRRAVRWPASSAEIESRAHVELGLFLV